MSKSTFLTCRVPASRLSTLFLTSVSKVVVSKVLDSGPDGEYPPKSNHDAVLRKFVSSHYAVSYFNNTLHAKDVERYSNQQVGSLFTYIPDHSFPALAYFWVFVSVYS